MKSQIILLCFFMALLSLNCNAQSKVDLTLLRQVDQIQKKAASQAKSATGVSTAEDFVNVTGVLAEGQEIPYSQLEELGITVSYTAFRNIGLVVPVSAMPKLDGIKEFLSFSAPKTFHLDNKTARTVMHVDEIQNETSAKEAGLPSTYNGKGVIVGVFDQGIDYNHANFRDPDTKQTRIKEAMVFRNYTFDDNGNMIDKAGQKVTNVSQVMELYTNPAEIDTLTTDFREQSHGTHTSGTAAGSYTGNYKDVADKIVYTGHQGIAPKADLILAGAKNLADEFEYVALSEMDKYAAQVNEPLVVNLSIGTYKGWFDGKDETPLFYDDFTQNGEKKGRVVCVSAGNSADCNYTMYKELNSSNNHTINTVIGCYKTTDESKPYAVRTNLNFFSSNSSNLTINTYTYNPKTNTKTELLTHSKLKSYNPQLLYEGNSDAHDGRYYATLGLTMSNADSLQLVVEIKSEADCKVRIVSLDGSGSPQALIASNLTGATAGDANSSINTSNCTNSIISVGAWRDNLKWNLYSVNGKSGYYMDLTKYGYKVGEICNFSSYCLADDNGYARPDVAAPGCMLLSGFNNYDASYFQTDGTPYSTSSFVCGVAEEEYGRKDSRHSAFGALQGTSQACPNVVGIIALWLQANPQLTQNQIKDVIANTCDTDDFTKAHPEQFGYGKINALKGLQYILKTYPTAIYEVVNGEPKGLDEPNTKKVMKDGKLVIMKNGKQYAVSGQRLD